MDEANSLLLSLHSRGDTRRFGRRLAACLMAGDLVVLEGDLGAGKTFLARAIARGLGVATDVRITSPTFDLVHEFEGRVPLQHLDLYRLEQAESLIELGIGEPGSRPAVTLVEWGDRFARALGDEGLWLRLTSDGNVRRCAVAAHGARGSEIVEELRQLLRARDFHGPRCRARAD